MQKTVRQALSLVLSEVSGLLFWQEMLSHPKT